MTTIRTDIQFELLATLPCPPASAALADLAAQHDLDQSDVRRILRATGLDLTFSQSGGRYVVSLDALDWACIQPRVAEWWRRRYGE